MQINIVVLEQAGSRERAVGIALTSPDGDLSTTVILAPKVARDLAANLVRQAEVAESRIIAPGQAGAPATPGGWNH